MVLNPEMHCSASLGAVTISALVNEKSTSSSVTEKRGFFTHGVVLCTHTHTHTEQFPVSPVSKMLVSSIHYTTGN